MSFDLQKELEHYGAPEGSVRILSETDAQALRYVDLLPTSASRKAMAKVPLPDAVLEYDGRLLIYLYRSDALSVAPEKIDLGALIRSLACRGDGAYVAIVRPGELVVYPVALSTSLPTPERFRSNDSQAPMLVHDLANGCAADSLRQYTANAKSLHKLLFKLIQGVSIQLRNCRALSSSRELDQVLPLVGRAIFTRFLIDRGIINLQTFPRLYKNTKPEHCFSTPELAARTCAWLDDKFNGDLLPLFFDVKRPTYSDYLAFFEKVDRADGRALHHVSNVMFRAPDGKLSLELSWDGVDFAHVPIGLLSEVYEDYAHRFYKDDALRESVWYTPRSIAETTVEQAFWGLPKARRHQARILDPAAGAGIFLVLAFQRLVTERFEATGKRPDTAEIRTILNTQIRGFDINSSALTLAALSLYLVALELDPEPFPPEKLRFDRLVDSVLCNMRGKNERYPHDKLVLGSLGPKGDLSGEDEGYDIVLGNPPWTGFTGWNEGERDFNAYVEGMVRRIMAARRATDSRMQHIAEAYRHNDQLPDTAFLWRAIEWAKPNGVIALIVAGRFLFKRGDTGIGVRNALFQAMRVTGILNGALALPMWPMLSQPFCVVFAINSRSKPTDSFTFVTPVLEQGPGNEPRMRIDSEAQQPIELQTLVERPYLLKVLTRGGRLDVDIVRRLQTLLEPLDAGNGSETAPAIAKPIGEYWAQWSQGKKRFGQGYIPGTLSKTVRKRLRDIVSLNPLSLTSDDLIDEAGNMRLGPRISSKHLGEFKAQDMYRLADPAIFLPPLVLVKEGFGDSTESIRARLYLGERPIVFRRNFYGFSCAGHPDGKFLAKYLFCLLNSDLFGYYTLQASAKFGVERRTLLVEDVTDFPIVTLERLTSKQRDSIEAAAANLQSDDKASWRALNRCVNNLYGITGIDEQVMKDTLETMMPYERAESRAAESITSFRSPEVRAFGATLKSMLRPFFREQDGESISVDPVDLGLHTWVAFDVKSNGQSPKSNTNAITMIAAALANQEGASRIIQKAAEGYARIVVRNQYRYLTPSRARVCAIDILREHGSVFPLKAI